MKAFKTLLTGLVLTVFCSGGAMAWDNTADYLKRIAVDMKCSVDGACDIGTAAKSFGDLYVDGVAYFGSITVGTSAPAGTIYSTGLIVSGSGTHELYDTATGQYIDFTEDDGIYIADEGGAGTAKLTIDGAAYIGGTGNAITFDEGEYLDSPVDQVLYVGSNNGVGLARFQVDGQIYAQGNVGIGTVNPTTYLEIKKERTDQTGVLSIGSGALNSVTGISFQSGRASIGFTDTYHLLLQGGSNRGVSILTNVSALGVGTPAIIANSSGNVGIGTNQIPTAALMVGGGTPSRMLGVVNSLYVKGSVEIDGNLYVDGFIYVRGTAVY